MTTTIPSHVAPIAQHKRVHLFVPCYIDQLYPDVAMATATVLIKAGCTVEFDPRQTCCGQPMANSGCAGDAAKLARRHLDLFRGKVTVCPSGSCTSMVRNHYQHGLGLDLNDADRETMANTFELSEFLVDHLGIDDVGARFPHTVAVHQSCHGLRELGLGSMSERGGAVVPSQVERLLRKVRGLTLVLPERRDECCGFGGTFAVAEDGLSARMGQDRCAQLAATGAAYMTGGDMSCLMHLEGIRARLPAAQRGPQAIHFAEILACA
ncbi:Fe-S oxidoreductase [Planctomycetota bacterium]|nr:Fe-S oxidoreductase [Planctomycetota bacterium]